MKSDEKWLMGIQAMWATQNHGKMSFRDLAKIPFNGGKLHGWIECTGEKDASAAKKAETLRRLRKEFTAIN